MPSRPRVPAWLLRWELERHLRRRDGVTLQGHHNENLVVDLSLPLALAAGVRRGERGKFRTSLRTVEVVPRLWDEAAVVEAVRAYVPEVPRCLAVAGDTALYAYAEGAPLAQRAPRGTRVGEPVLSRIATIFGHLSEVPVSALPELPADWPADGDSAGFLRRLADFAEERVHRANRREFGQLFDDLGIPRRAMDRFLADARSLRSRPFGLLHTDLHRDNLIELGDGGGLSVIDWEIALYGDPLHDLATHLVRMGYVEEERERLEGLWRAEMRRRGHGDRLAGMEADLGLYVDFEIGQSVYPDALRAALALPPDADDTAYARAAARVHRALRRARAPLRIAALPSEDAVGEALRAWHAGRGRTAPGRTDPGRARDEEVLNNRALPVDSRVMTPLPTDVPL
ncbi:phosphotransferase family protein [Streptomyces sp. DH37]|uniref:phosphotransferase family protein n=1 Tax=Streptomyces sp. DH37 TaxID=3040122 RepID=UPI002442E69E|nr:phosphotransferase [Streptomyces sp. DH37]MDG9702955.1 phosphotransferase [Streptomyces sp. DH37]